MLLKHIVVNDYYIQDNHYPFPPKDIQMKIMRLASKLNIETCRNIRLVGKCFAEDSVINQQMNIWIYKYDRPRKIIHIIQSRFNKYHQQGYFKKMLNIFKENINIRFYYLWSDGKKYPKGETIPFSHVGLLKLSQTKDEVAFLISAKKRIMKHKEEDSVPDVLYFLYFDNQNRSIYHQNEDILNDFEKNILNCCKDNPTVFYFGNLHIKVDDRIYCYLTKKKYPLPSSAYAHFADAFYGRFPTYP